MHLISWYLGKSEHEESNDPMVMSPTRPRIDTPSEKYLSSRPLSNHRASLRLALFGAYILPGSSRSHTHHLQHLLNFSKSVGDSPNVLLFLSRKLIVGHLCLSLPLQKLNRLFRRGQLKYIRVGINRLLLSVHYLARTFSKNTTTMSSCLFGPFPKCHG
jgi:hypothetical protein